MFVIKNTTERDVVLDDLRVVLGPNKQIDLDKVAPRHQSDTSAKLRLMLHQKKIRIVARDTDELEPVPQVAVAITLREMEQRLKEEFRVQLQAAMKLSQVGPVQNTSVLPVATAGPDLSTLNETIRSLIDQLQHQTPAPQQTGGEIVSNSSDGGLADDISSKLHAKAVKRIEKNVTGHVEHEEKVERNEALHKNISELEGLL